MPQVLLLLLLSAPSTRHDEDDDVYVYYVYVYAMYAGGAFFFLITNSIINEFQKHVLKDIVYFFTPKINTGRGGGRSIFKCSGG